MSQIVATEKPVGTSSIEEGVKRRLIEEMGDDLEYIIHYNDGSYTTETGEDPSDEVNTDVLVNEVAVREVKDLVSETGRDYLEGPLDMSHVFSIEVLEDGGVVFYSPDGADKEILMVVFGSGYFDKLDEIRSILV
ncbi:MAG: hypothetical protein ABEK59_05675 [Halobacteria archaeon]